MTVALAGRVVAVGPEGLSSLLSDPGTFVGLDNTWASLLPSGTQGPTPGFEEARDPLGTPAPVANPSAQYAFLLTQPSDDGQTIPVTWSPCRPIHYLINEDGAPDGFVGHVVATVNEVSVATGLVFVYEGTTTERPDPNRPAYLPDLYENRWAPVLIEFADEDSIPLLAGNAVGLGGDYRIDDPTTGITHYVSGTVHLDTELLDFPDHDGEPAYAPVLRHELGHVAGLAHVDDPTQLMYPETGAVLTFQSGDLTGLAALGKGTCAPGI